MDTKGALVEKQEQSQIEKNEDLYLVQGWGDGYFRINAEGHIAVFPKREGKGVDLYALASLLQARGLKLPLLLNFSGIIEDRLMRICSAFQEAISAFQYKNGYQLIYPIKVNQQKPVVDVIRKAGKEQGIGLEVGSKPELLAVMGMHDAKEALFLCNGYKDAAYIELALLAKKAGKRPILVVEQFYELPLILQIGESLHLKPEIGLRMKPSSSGEGRWAASGGSEAKFGLTAHEIVEAVELLRKAGRSDSLKLLHLHGGSQLKSLASIRRFVQEGARMYVALAKGCPSLSFLDIGGGLAVEYIGQSSSSSYGCEYTLEEYAAEVVQTVGAICDEEAVLHPTIITESGRALTSHHSVLLTEVIDALTEVDEEFFPKESEATHPVLKQLLKLYQDLDAENCHKTYRALHQHKQEILDGFMQGQVTLKERAFAEKLLPQLFRKIHNLLQGMPILPQKIPQVGSDMYFCNCSIFRSLPDVWAIEQKFPVIPIHRLDEEPTRRGVLVDLTCDSDGEIRHFITKEGEGPLPLHPLNNAPYYLGFFLVGAYQEILGGFHNLLGRTASVCINLSEERYPEFSNTFPGDSAKEVLAFVQHDPIELQERFQLALHEQLERGALSSEEAEYTFKKFSDALGGYTYLCK